MSVRHLLERLGWIEPRPSDIDEVRSEAMEINEQARREIHASRNRRAFLELRLERERRIATRR